MKLEKKAGTKDFTNLYNASNIHQKMRNKYGEAYDLYRKQWEYAEQMDNTTDYPIQLDFELNYSCNFSCTMCTWSKESVAKRGKNTWLDFNIFQEILDEGVSKGLKAIRLNYINEPMIRKDLFRFIKYAKNLGIIDVYFSTNGSLLNEENSRSLVESGLDRLQVSLDAFTSETFNKIAILIKEWFKNKSINCNIRYIDFPSDLIKSYQNYTCANITNLRKNDYNEKFISLETGINRYLSFLHK